MALSTGNSRNILRCYRCRLNFTQWYLLIASLYQFVCLAYYLHIISINLAQLLLTTFHLEGRGAIKVLLTAKTEGRVIRPLILLNYRLRWLCFTAVLPYIRHVQFLLCGVLFSVNTANDLGYLTLFIVVPPFIQKFMLVIFWKKITTCDKFVIEETRTESTVSDTPRYWPSFYSPSVEIAEY